MNKKANEVELSSKTLKLDILEDFAYECSVDAKISKYI
jgi:hypothetical protein